MKDEPRPYGGLRSYEIAHEFLRDCPTVEDWGCGGGFFETLRPDAVGVDGSLTPFADVVVDLRGYRSECDGVLLRHVLEHNDDWRSILENACASARRKVCVVLFTPMSVKTQQIAFTPELGVPDISFALGDLLEVMDGFEVCVEELWQSATQYGEETILRGLHW